MQVYNGNCTSFLTILTETYQVWQEAAYLCIMAFVQQLKDVKIE